MSRSRSLDVSVRQGAIEDASRSENFGIGLRVFSGASHAYGSTADSSNEGLELLARQVCAMAKAVPEDTYTRLATPKEFAKDFILPDLFDDAPSWDVKELGRLASVAESAAISQKGITQCDSSSAGQAMHWIGLSTSEGFSGGYASTSSYIGLSVIAGKDDGMETDSASASAVYMSDLEDAEVVGLRAATRTLQKLGPRTGKKGAFPVIFERRVAGSLLRSFSRSISGPRLAKGTSFLNGKAGESVFSKAITIIDDPLVPRGRRSVPFDGEGMPVQRLAMVSGGVLNHCYLDLRSAARLGLKAMGHASRGLSSPPSPSPSNLWIEAGTVSLGDMIQNIKQGFLVTDLMGASISLSTGDYSRGASGFWIENGEIAYPVSEMTIAGNLKGMFLNMTPASDLEFREGIDAPSLLIEGMTTASREAW
ncbi:MAG: TldD/PmbA family protein [Alphaproteobacteria bacterium]|nr:TldD/PmbA family protein [Alphaproteobacteria bacterium]